MKKVILPLLFVLLFLSVKAQYNEGITVRSLLKTDTTSIGQPIVYPSSVNDEVTILKITIPPGKETGWHKHEFPVFAVVLKGTLTVQMKDKTLQFGENSSFAEVLNTLHNGINTGTEEVVLIAFYAGQKGKALSVHE
jgi:quercetin dioxygenase-like cupin family protein